MAKGKMIEHFYDEENKVLTIKYNNLMNRELTIPMEPELYQRLRKIDESTKLRLEMLGIAA